MGTGLNLDALMAFAKKGGAARVAVNTLLESAKKCQHCGQIFLPQVHNHKFCSYACRNARREELRRKNQIDSICV